MKSYLKILIIIMIILSMTGLKIIKPVQVSYLYNDFYYTELLKSIKTAQKSIYIVMYVIMMTSYKKHKVNILIGELINAYNRGVKIKIILDDTVVTQNKKVFEELTEYGIDIKFDSHKILTHSKFVVIDEYVTFIGSHNWTGSAFMANVESTVKIKSKYCAQIYIDAFRNIKTIRGLPKDFKINDNNKSAKKFDWKKYRQNQKESIKQQIKFNMMMLENYIMNKLDKPAIQVYFNLRKKYKLTKTIQIKTHRLINKIKSKYCSCDFEPFGKKCFCWKDEKNCDCN